MKGLYIHSEMFGTTGPAIHGREFMAAMAQLGVDLELFPPTTRLYSFFQWVRDSRKVSKIKYLRTFILYIEPYLGILIGLQKCGRFIRGQYDFVIVRTTDFSINLMDKKKLLDNCPTILEVNSIISGDLAAKPTGRFLSYSDTLQKRELLLLQKAKAIYVVSERLMLNLIEAGIEKNKINIIPNGVDPERFDPKINGDRIRKKHKFDNKIVVGFVGEVRYGHDINALVEGFSAATKHFENLFLLIVGPNKYFLQEVIDKEKIGSKVFVTGTIAHAKIPEYMSAIDIAVSPIKYLVYCPLKNFEYMAMAKPIIATDLGHTTSMLRNGVSAILIKPNSSKAMCEAILRLAKDKDLRDKIGKEARKIVVEGFTWKHNAQKVLNIIYRCRKEK